jgi:feruloyl esterase
VFASLYTSLVLADAQFERTCAELAGTLSIENTTVSSVGYVAAGTTLTFPTLAASCGANTQLVSVDICRVNLIVSTSTRSETVMEAWLPRNWTGRFLATGNGGLNGCVGFDDIAYGISLGFATTGSNNGHTNGQNGTDFLNNADVVIDFSWRGLHTSVLVGKQVAKEFYGTPHTKSYYLGCSTGGRQGFKMAQDFPDNFDGIVAGAPAIAFNNLTSWSGQFYPLLARAGPGGFPPQSSWPVIEATLLAQCDTLDGAADGIFEDASLCDFRPEVLICGTAYNGTDCITDKQAATIRAIFSDLHGLDNALVYPRMQPGPGLLIAVYSIYSASQFLYTDHWFKYAVYNNPNLDTSTITPEQMAYAWSLNTGNINTWSGDLSAVAARGSKILHYHGQADPIISSSISNRYYEHVSSTMQLSTVELDEFYRFFRISGMGHCSGGNGASVIGNRLSNTASLDPDENVLMAMVRWVEEGIPPQTVVGTAYVNQTADLGVNYKRAHCKYPLRNHHSCAGDIKDSASWKCVP